MSSSNETPDSLDTTLDIEQYPINEPIRTGPSPQAEKPHGLQRMQSHLSGQEIVDQDTQSPEHSDEIYQKFSPRRKIIITSVLSFCGLLAPISSTTILSATPEVAEAYNTSGTIINISQALFLISMGFSPCFWSPVSQIYGRRWICIIAAASFTVFSIGTALAPNLAAYFIFRIFTAFEGTCFLLMGAACISDIYVPTERGTALGWFLSGTLIGPAFGPFIGGVIVNFVSWRVIFWLQTALGGIAAVLCFFFLPETIHRKKSEVLHGLGRIQQARKIAQMINPIPVLKFFAIPNFIAVGFGSSSLVWNMYSLLTPIRYVLNPRFHLTSPIESGLFYLAPGAGYLVGTFFGGRYADYIVKKYIAKRGRRVPEDRLRSCLPFLGIAIPGCIIIYGWSIDKEVGGVPLPVIMMFLQGIAQLFCFPALNAYCLDVVQGKSAEVIAGNYLVRYMFSAAGSAACLPAVDAIGVGWFSTISAAFLIASAISVLFTSLYGEGWRLRYAQKHDERHALRDEKTKIRNELLSTKETARGRQYGRMTRWIMVRVQR